MDKTALSESFADCVFVLGEIESILGAVAGVSALDHV